jgi:hypothetical protein
VIGAADGTYPSMITAAAIATVAGYWFVGAVVYRAFVVRICALDKASRDAPADRDLLGRGFEQQVVDRRGEERDSLWIPAVLSGWLRCASARKAFKSKRRGTEVPRR